MPIATLTAPQGHSAINAILAEPRAEPRPGRRPALPGFLARKLLAIAWTDGVPARWSRWHVEVTCRAELEWAAADWRRMVGWAGSDVTDWGTHPSETCRLPVEFAAARALNALTHLNHDADYARKLRRAMRAQRQAANDETCSAGYRAHYARAAEDTFWERLGLLERRRRAAKSYIAALDHYRALRAAIDAPFAIAAE